MTTTPFVTTPSSPHRGMTPPPPPLKLLLKVGKPMVQIGNVLELWLNLLSSNGGLLRLFTNFLTDYVNVTRLGSLPLGLQDSK
ncbi:hypothetical protein CFP56_009100, partial [Quercus suber]